MKQKNKPVIEATINQVAFVLTSAGVVMLVAENNFGFALILFSLGIEWFKYWGRRKYW